MVRGERQTDTHTHTHTHRERERDPNMSYDRMCGGGGVKKVYEVCVCVEEGMG